MIKHKVILDFQFVTNDKKIFVLKTGTILEDYKYRVKNDSINIDKDIVDNNPEFFSVIEWKSELHSYIKLNKLPQPAQLAKKLIPFIEDMILSSISQNKQIDDSDITRRESEIDRKLKIINNKEEDIKKKEYNLSEKESLLDVKLKNFEDKLQDIKNYEGPIDKNVLWDILNS